MDYNPPVRHRAVSGVPGWLRQYASRYAKSSVPTVRVAATPRTIPMARQDMWTIHHRSLCNDVQHPATALQQLQSRSIQPRRGRPGPVRLGAAQQLRQRPFQAIATDIAKTRVTRSQRDNNRALVASAALGTNPDKAEYASPASFASVTADTYTTPGGTRTSEKPQVGPVRLAGMWYDKLRAVGWSTRAASQLRLAWAPSTLHSYDRTFTDFLSFCVQVGCEFPPSTSASVADYMCVVADRSERPASLTLLRSIMAALSHLYHVTGRQDVTKSPDLSLLQSALVKSGTRKVRLKSLVMPITPFVNLFKSWPDNLMLDIARLRLNTLVLLSLCLMLRPSDIAPRSVCFDTVTMSQTGRIFSTDMVVFNSDGSCDISFHGIKQDTDRAGFTAHLPPAVDPHIYGRPKPPY